MRCGANYTIRREATATYRWSPRSAPDSVALIAQLRKTEAAFEDLQRRYGELTDQLTATRRAAAGKQLKLSAAENRVNTMANEAERLRIQLEAELLSRNRMEWLFVAFITLMVLVMTLISPVVSPAACPFRRHGGLSPWP